MSIEQPKLIRRSIATMLTMVSIPHAPSCRGASTTGAGDGAGSKTTPEEASAAAIVGVCTVPPPYASSDDADEIVI
jgi:hypothetical protein